MECGLCGRTRAFGRDRINEFQCGHIFCNDCVPCSFDETYTKILSGMCINKECSHPGRFTIQRQAFLAGETKPSNKNLIHDSDLTDSMMRIEEVSITRPAHLTSVMMKTEVPEILPENAAPITMTDSLGMKIKYTSNLSETELSKVRCRRCGRKNPIQAVDILKLSCGHVLCKACMLYAYGLVACPFFRCQSSGLQVETLKFIKRHKGKQIVYVKMATECVNGARMMPWDGVVPNFLEMPQPIPGIFPLAHTTAADLPDSW